VSIHFSGPLNAARAEMTAEYRLLIAGTNGSFTAKNARIIALKSAVYNGATLTVTLSTVKPFKLSKPVDVQIDAMAPSGLIDSSDRLIDSQQNDGPMGGNIDAILRKKSVTISTEERAARPRVASVAHRHSN
jgi:hypothetical protein